jgi:DNA-binding NarL/FixJ family response regulator
MVVGQARNSQEALQQTDSPCPDLIIVGPHLAESGLSVCREISRRLPTLKILLFTAHTDNPLFLADAANAGIAACLPPETTEEECLAMIAKVMAH